MFLKKEKDIYMTYGGAYPVAITVSASVPIVFYGVSKLYDEIAFAQSQEIRGGYVQFAI